MHPCMYDFFGLGEPGLAPFHPEDNNVDDQEEQANWDAWPQDAQGENNSVPHIDEDPQ
jgi:hypothetical protein